jgi:hypothetical protein
LRERATKYVGGWRWTDGDVWHGTAPSARELVDAGPLDRDVVIASYHPPGTPTPTLSEYALGLTDSGRERLELT